MNPSHTYPATSARSRALTIACWLLQIVAAAAFFGAGFAKLTGAPAMVDVYERVGLGQWFRIVTGVLEVAGAIGLLIPGTIFYAAVLLACVMAGAIVAHLTLLGGSPFPAIVLLVLVLIVAWLRKPARTLA